MISASGALIISKNTGRICLQCRSESSSYSKDWGLWGGKIETNELPIEALYRELKEELGINLEILKIYPLHKFESIDSLFEYNTFLVIVDNEFVPELNEESSSYIWIKLENVINLNLHPGTKNNIFLNKSIINKVNKIMAINKPSPAF